MCQKKLAKFFFVAIMSFINLYYKQIPGGEEESPPKQRKLENRGSDRDVEVTKVCHEFPASDKQILILGSILSERAKASWETKKGESGISVIVEPQFL
jgi:hypothetical protein